MKLTKCLKTVSKKHVWRPILMETGEFWSKPIFQLDGDRFYKKCIACGIVDDTETFGKYVENL